MPGYLWPFAHWTTTRLPGTTGGCHTASPEACGIDRGGETVDPCTGALRLVEAKAGGAAACGGKFIFGGFGNAEIGAVFPLVLPLGAGGP
jgi:hypothetical protein